MKFNTRHLSYTAMTKVVIVISRNQISFVNNLLMLLICLVSRDMMKYKLVFYSNHQGKVSKLAGFREHSQLSVFKSNAVEHSIPIALYHLRCCIFSGRHVSMVIVNGCSTATGITVHKVVELIVEGIQNIHCIRFFTQNIPTANCCLSLSFTLMKQCNLFIVMS